MTLQEQAPTDRRWKFSFVDDEEDSPAMHVHVFPITTMLTENDRINSSDGWQARRYTSSELHARLSQHVRIVSKDNAEAFLPGLLHGTKRNAAAVSRLDMMIFDVDDGVDIETVTAHLTQLGFRAIVHSTYNHLTAQTDVPLDALRQFATGRELTPELVRDYLRVRKRYSSRVLSSLEVDAEYLADPNRSTCLVRHVPISKYRIALPLWTPFRRSAFPAANAGGDAFVDGWKAKYAAVGAMLGIDYDHSCSDVARAFYFPTCRPNAESFAQVIEGALLDLDAIEVPVSAPETKPGPHADHSYHGISLDAWIASYGETFRIEDALRRSKNVPPDFFRGTRAGGGVHIQCPFEHEHSQIGGEGTFVVNGGGDQARGFVTHCCHQSCLTRRGNGASIDRLAFVYGMLVADWLTIGDLQNPQLGGGPISMRRYYDAKAAKRTSSRAVDRDGLGIDLAVFHANFVAKRLFDFARINALCGTQIAEDVTVDQLVGFVEQGLITRSQLVLCVDLGDKHSKSDPYSMKLSELAEEVVAGTVSGREKGARLDAIGEEFKVRRKDLEKDYEAAARSAGKRDWRLGLLSPEETALIAPTGSYAQRYAILKVGSQVALLDTHEVDISRAIIDRSDFAFLKSQEWIETIGSDGRTKTVFPAKEFIAKPPKETRIFDRGLVFKPGASTVGPGEYNLFRGFAVAPDPSGSCDLFYALLRDVWAHGDQETFEWVCEFLWDIVAHPGEKPGTALAIRGGQGDGKSIVFEVCMATILGDMLLRVTNPSLVLGDFNECLVGKLLIVLEEATFVGDKKLFERLKDLITGQQVTINAKFKAPFPIENYARNGILSNSVHFMQHAADDRRYTVLESNDCWKGTDRFEQMIAQWHSGGAARFMHDALNHSFRRLPGRERLVISTSLKTGAAVEQTAHSRSALDICMVKLLLEGSLTGLDTVYGHPAHYDGELVAAQYDLWSWEGPADVVTTKLEQGVKAFLRNFDPSEARRNHSLSHILKAFERYAGPGEEIPRGKIIDPLSGRRLNAPTARRYLGRKDALDRALTLKLVTQAEYDMGYIPPEPAEPVEDPMVKRYKEHDKELKEQRDAENLQGLA